MSVLRLVQNSFIHNHNNGSKWWLDKQIINYYSRIKKEYITETLRNMDELQKYYANWKKSYAKDWIFCLYEILGKTQLQWRKIDQWLPGLRGCWEGGIDMKGHEGTFRVMGKLPIMIEHTCQTRWIIPLKVVSFMICQLFLNKANKKIQ